ncbi:disease resistance protein RUN1-like isoform X1 [Phaseolus vulgaris]
MELASSSSKIPLMYDVVINFNGEDIQRKFVSHLDSALSAVGFTTFLHHPNALHPIHIQQPILNLSRVAIVVFTKSYSQSAWCLQQLHQIIEWHETYCRHVLPIYYEIEPSDVRLQMADFGKAFKETAQHTFSGQQLEHAISRWSHALTKAANFFGWNESNYRSDAELVDEIVKTVLNLPVLSATKFPVGLQSHMEDLIRTIKYKSTEVCKIAICGQGGSGKTTLAKAIYHQIHDTFTEKSFIEDIGQVSRIRGDLRVLEQLLSDVLKSKVEIDSFEMGRTMIRERLSGKRVLIVLDDVPEFNRELLWEYRHWFGGGSVIIITTIPENLPRIYEVDSVFQVKLMNANESLELLSWHAFREAKPKQEYHVLAERVVSYCGGLPLALEVIGSYLYERTKEEWNSVLLRLDNIPQHDLQRKLKISFDRLRNQMEKDLFLDVCCSFVGKSRSYVTKILNGCGIDADSGIRVLIKHSLIQINKDNKLIMHPLLREMGREIIRQISGKEPEKNSKLWFDKDARYSLSENTLFSSKGTKIIQRLPTGRDFFGSYPLHVSDPSRLLKLGRDYHLKKLRWISLRGFSSEYLPNDFYLHDAIAIDVKHSLLRFLWKEPQVLAWLKILNLSHSKYLRETPHFSGLPSLEQLILKDCPRLRKVHRSIGRLCNLILLNLKDCTSLSNLPREIYKLKCLKTLILSGCLKIDLMEKDIVRMKSLITLMAENTVMKQLPFTIVSPKIIGYISLRGSEGLSHNLFPSIIRSRMSPTMNPLSYIHPFMDMEDNSWDDIAPFLRSLANLRTVLVECDAEFHLSEQVKTTVVEYGGNNTESAISKNHLKSFLTGVGRYKEFFNTVSDNIPKVFASSESCDVSLPGDNDPYWLAHMGDGHSVSLTVPQDRVVKGMAFCVDYLSTSKIIEPKLTTVLIVNYTNCTCQIHNHGTVISSNDEDWPGIMSNLGSGDKVEIFVSFGNGLVVKNTTAYLICDESNDLEKEPVPKKISLLKFIKKTLM